MSAAVYECNVDVCGWRGMITQLDASRPHYFCPICGAELLWRDDDADTSTVVGELGRIATALEAVSEVLADRVIAVNVVGR